MSHPSLPRLVCAVAAILLLGGVGLARADRFDDDLLGLINRYRSTKGLKALASSPRLNELALEHSQAMREQERMSHDGFEDRFRRASDDGARGCVENVGWNHPTPRSLFTGWKESSGHNRNMLERKINRVGIGRSGAYVTFFACY